MFTDTDFNTVLGRFEMPDTTYGSIYDIVINFTNPDTDEYDGTSIKTDCTAPEAIIKSIVSEYWDSYCRSHKWDKDRIKVWYIYSYLAGSRPRI